MKKNYNEICHVLKEQRNAAQMTQAELGKFFGCGEALIEKWETGVGEPTITEALILSKLYGISLDEFFSGFDVESIIPHNCKVLFDNAAKIHSMERRCSD